MFFFVRMAWLKKKGVDLNAIMSTPFPGWEARERELAGVEASEKKEK
ncbi:MAG: hypothetical protein HFI64_09040 [Lachnospiraceae bacterium]|nr:hypothetical protein [Lachnospiraceae bacterium]